MALIKRAVRERDFSSVDFTLLLCPFTVLGVIRIVLGLLFVAFRIRDVAEPAQCDCGMGL